MPSPGLRDIAGRPKNDNKLRCPRVDMVEMVVEVFAPESSLLVFIVEERYSGLLQSIPDGGCIDTFLAREGKGYLISPLFLYLVCSAKRRCCRWNCNRLD